MKKAAANEINRGQALSFRVPSDTPDHILKQLQKLKETERRNFSSKLAEFVMQGVSHSFSREKEAITIPLPKNLTKAERDWLKHEHSEALLGSILYQLISDPVRATSLLASLDSNALDIDEALYLQEEISTNQSAMPALKENYFQNEIASTSEVNDLEDDLDVFDWESTKKQPLHNKEELEEEELDADDLLSGFLTNMNK
ncbi:hypothetical protein [Neobacillus sp.]|uniref:hypothetical protein n=1 Tax=Neobacillus sp. TaxID=2675273 RepID=UPI00289E46CD|nr:hypothetical protein [Neobacillus sp.]